MVDDVFVLVDEIVLSRDLLVRGCVKNNFGLSVVGVVVAVDDEDDDV